MIEKKKRIRISKTPLLLTFGQNVKRLRQSKQLSQEALAELADLHPTYISNVEQGNRNLSLETANQIAKALGTTLVSLLEN